MTSRAGNFPLHVHGQLAIRSPNHIFEPMHAESVRPRGNEGGRHQRRLKHDIYHLVVVDFARIFGLFMANLDGLRSASSTGSISHQLSLNASIHGTKQENCTVDRFGYGQVTMALKNHSFSVPESFGDVFTLVRIECDATESRIYSVVVVESACLSGHPSMK